MLLWDGGLLYIKLTSDWLLRPKYWSLDMDLALANRFDASPSPFVADVVLLFRDEVDELDVYLFVLVLLLVFDDRPKSFISMDVLDGPFVVALRLDSPPYLSRSSTITQSDVLLLAFLT